MFKGNLLNHYLGPSPGFRSPTAVIAIHALQTEIETLFHQQEKLGAVLQSDFHEKRGLSHKLIKRDADGVVSGEVWFCNWFHVLLQRSGHLLIEAPVAGSSTQSRGGEKQWHCKIAINFFSENLTELKGILDWSIRSWNYCISRQVSPQVEQALREHVPQQKARPKSSFIAMAKYLANKDVLFTCEWQVVSLLKIGIGINTQRISHKITDQTSGWGMEICKNKAWSKLQLSNAGIPIAPFRVARDLQAAQQFADQIGFPVVTKPLRGDQGEGVVTAIATMKELEEGWKFSKTAGLPILIERHHDGRDFRFLVVKGRLLAGLERIPGGVVGDGVQTIAALIDSENQARQGSTIDVESGEQLRYVCVDADEEALTMLTKQGLNLDTVPELGKFVRLRYAANFSHGGTVRECLHDIHPFNRFLLEKAARLTCLDVVGIDVIASGIDEPLTTNGGIVCELNGMPGILPHMLAEPSRCLVAELTELLLKPQQHVPIIGICSRNAAALIKAIESNALSQQPALLVGSCKGVRQCGQLVNPLNATQAMVQRRLVQDGSATALLLELDCKEVLNHGLPVSNFDLLILGEQAMSGFPPEWAMWIRSCSHSIIEINDTQMKTSPSLIQTIDTAVEILQGCSP